MVGLTEGKLIFVPKLKGKLVANGVATGEITGIEDVDGLG